MSLHKVAPTIAVMPTNESVQRATELISNDLVSISDASHTGVEPPPPPFVASGVENAAQLIRRDGLGAALTLEQLPSRRQQFAGAPFSAPAWPPAVTQPGSHLTWQGTPGRFMWDSTENAPAPHIRRWCGTAPVCALQAGRARSFTDWIRAGGSIGREGARPLHAIRTLWEWLASRPRLVEGCVGATIDRPDDCTGLPFGFCVRLDLPAASRIDAELDDSRYRRSFHGTALEVLQRIVHRGLETGWARNVESGRELQGIYTLAAERAHLLSSYILYSSLDDSGWLYGPFVEVRSPHADPQMRKTVLRRRGGTNRDQWISYPDSTTMTHVWVHVVHVASLYSAPADANVSLWAEPMYQRELEVHPEASWEELLQRSRDGRDIVL